jgi:hypothetical protein
MAQTNGRSHRPAEAKMIAAKAPGTASDLIAIVSLDTAVTPDRHLAR